MKILITGASGYIAANLTKYLCNMGCDVITVSRKELTGTKHFTSDLSDESKIYAIINDAKPDIIIHTVWLNSLSKCEDNKDLAWHVNVEWSYNLINAIKKTDMDIKLVFLSSDYVFDGTRGRYKEQDHVNPVTYYGETKVKVEELIQESGIRHFICRTANVYYRGGHFFNFLYENLINNMQIEVFYDTYFTPTYMSYFLDSIFDLLNKDFEGIVHLTGSERISRYEFAITLAQVMNKDERLVIPVKKPSDISISFDSSLDTTYARKIMTNYCPTFNKSLEYALGYLIYPYFSHFDHRGGIYGITQDTIWEEINYVESAKGSIRGNHYHKETIEGFYIIEGIIEVELLRIKTNDKIKYIVRRGDSFNIQPNTLHTFKILEGAKWINFLSKPMKANSKDLHKITP